LRRRSQVPAAGFPDMTGPQLVPPHYNINPWAKIQPIQPFGSSPA
jgi:hypothetical protein